MKVGHIGIVTDDIGKSRDFYVNNLGFKVLAEYSFETGNYRHFCFIRYGDTVLELLEPMDKTSITREPEKTTLHFALQVANLEEVMDKLKKNGLALDFSTPMINHTIFGGIKINFLRGPSNERIELVEKL